MKREVFLIIVFILAVFGWIRNRFFEEPAPAFWVVYWKEGTRNPVYYAIVDSADFRQTGGCVAIRDAHKEERVLCQNYKILAFSERENSMKRPGGEVLVPPFWKEKTANHPNSSQPKSLFKYQPHGKRKK